MGIVEFDTQEYHIDPTAILDTFMANPQIPAHVRQAWEEHKTWAEQSAIGAAASLELYQQAREQNERLLASVGKVG